MVKLLVCGSRKSNWSEKDNKIVWQYLTIEYMNALSLEIIEGCCPNSPDEAAEIFAKNNKDKVKIHHYPATSGTYLKRNIEMVEACDKVLAFYDGFSFGTGMTIANAVMRNKEVIIIHLDKNKGVILY